MMQTNDWTTLPVDAYVFDANGDLRHVQGSLHESGRRWLEHWSDEYAPASDDIDPTGPVDCPLTLATVTAAGEMGKLQIGDGRRHWVELPIWRVRLVNGKVQFEAGPHPGPLELPAQAEITVVGADGQAVVTLVWEFGPAERQALGSVTNDGYAHLVLPMGVSRG
jgi:hypothetical protein